MRSNHFFSSLIFFLNSFPAPVLKYSAIAFSPEWPKGGLPISWARQAAATTSPKWNFVKSFFNFGFRPSIRSPTKLPSDLPTTETSKLWVNLVWTKSLSGRGNTCVLSCNLLKAGENTIRSKSFWNWLLPSTVPPGEAALMPSRLSFNNSFQFKILS